jgi:Tat protein secretion system quality control protein TatD with DNase activity
MNEEENKSLMEEVIDSKLQKFLHSFQKKKKSYSRQLDSGIFLGFYGEIPQTGIYVCPH